MSGILLLFSGCGTSLPTDCPETDRQPVIYPDYSDVTIPFNIAPTNFYIDEPGDRYLTQISGEQGTSWIVRGQRVELNVRQWRKLLEANKGGDIAFEVYIQKGGQWERYKSIINHVSPDAIDPWVSYRLIEPGYEHGHRISLNQRHLETFKEEAFFDNRSLATSPCINCHSYQNRKTERYMFHYRRPDTPEDSGTIVVDHKNIRKINTNLPETENSATYPAWHPTENLIAFSANRTRQRFHSLSVNKVEVFDCASDLVLYDVENNSISHILKTPGDFETFPTWSPAGDMLYYCSAYLNTEELMKLDKEENINSRRVISQNNESTNLEVSLGIHYDRFKYNLMRIPFDVKTRTFGKPEVVIDAAAEGKSIVHPRISPDGNYLVYAMSDYGTFPIWHPECDLYELNLQTGETRPMTEINSDQSDSYHTWDSRGRWMVLSSRREDGSYTRLYFTHIGPDGQGTKPFVLPQKNPLHNKQRFKSYNVPEITREPIKTPFLKLVQAAATYPDQAVYETK